MSVLFESFWFSLRHQYFEYSFFHILEFFDILGGAVIIGEKLQIVSTTSEFDFTTEVMVCNVGTIPNEILMECIRINYGCITHNAWQR